MGVQLPLSGVTAPWTVERVSRDQIDLACAVTDQEGAPVLLARQDWEVWLDPATTDLSRLQALLVPAPDELLTFHRVSTEVNNVRNKGPFPEI